MAFMATGLFVTKLRDRLNDESFGFRASVL